MAFRLATVGSHINPRTTARVRCGKPNQDLTWALPTSVVETTPEPVESSKCVQHVLDAVGVRACFLKKNLLDSCVELGWVLEIECGHVTCAILLGDRRVRLVKNCSIHPSFLKRHGHCAIQAQLACHLNTTQPSGRDEKPGGTGPQCSPAAHAIWKSPPPATQALRNHSAPCFPGHAVSRPTKRALPTVTTNPPIRNVSFPLCVGVPE